jgi:hypothetical protein
MVYLNKHDGGASADANRNDGTARSWGSVEQFGKLDSAGSVESCIRIYI